MPIAQITPNTEPPAKVIPTKEYGELYDALYAAKGDEWTKVTIRYTKETKTREIANIRRAAQRFFAQADVRGAYRMVSRVEDTDTFSSDMYIQKKVRDIAAEKARKELWKDNGVMLS